MNIYIYISCYGALIRFTVVLDTVMIRTHVDCIRLSYLHSQKIVHRDVKTENMLLDKSRTLKIADFGVARLEASNPNDMTGETGTLGYMAPEVLATHIFNSVLLLILL